MPRTDRVLVTAVAFAVWAAPLAGCAQRPPPQVATARAGSGPTTASVDRIRLAEEYIECMRGQGVAMLDRLTPEGMPQIDKSKAAKDRILPAMEACRGLLPGGEQGDRVSPADIERLRRYAGCLRDHGVPDYPDPDPVTGEAELSPDLAARLKNDRNLPAAMRACEVDAPGATGGVVGG